MSSFPGFMFSRIHKHPVDTYVIFRNILFDALANVSSPRCIYFYTPLGASVKVISFFFWISCRIPGVLAL